MRVCQKFFIKFEIQSPSHWRSNTSLSFLRSYKSFVSFHSYSLRSQTLIVFSQKNFIGFPVSDELSNFPIIFITIFLVRFHHLMFLSSHLSYDSSSKPNSYHSISSIKTPFHLVSCFFKTLKSF